MTIWFARLDLSLASDAQKRVVQRTCDLLDRLEPVRLDPTDQAVEVVEGETWVKLRHDAEPDLEIQFVLSDGWVNFYGVMGHDEAYSIESERSDSWESETVDILADLLQSRYTIDRYELGGKPWRRTIAISDPYESLTTRVDSKMGLLPLGRWATHAGSRRGDFGCRGSYKSAAT